jgi:hypothetical protein
MPMEKPGSFIKSASVLIQQAFPIYIMGVEDKKYLAQTFGRDLGKASVTGYCIKFKTLADIKVDVLKAAIQYGIGQTSIQH